MNGAPVDGSLGPRADRLMAEGCGKRTEELHATARIQRVTTPGCGRELRVLILVSTRELRRD